MTDLASDPRVNELFLAQPAEIDALADYFDRAARESRHTATGLRAAQHDGAWHGDAGDSFRASIGGLPLRLDGLHAGFRDTGAALHAYGTEVHRLQTAFGEVSSALAAWSPRLAPARTALDAAVATLRRLLHSPAATPGEVATAQREVQRTEAALTELEELLAGLRRRGRQLLEEFDQERSACHARISAARALAPRAPVPVRLGLTGTTPLAPPA